MARSKAAVESCLICAPDPCACFASKKKSRGSRSRTPEVSVAAATSATEIESPVSDLSAGVRASARDRMKAAAAAAPTLSTSIVTSPSVVPAAEGSTDVEDRRVVEAQPQPPPAPGPDAVLAAAIRALAPILHPEEKQRYAVIVGTPATASDRAAQWLERRGA